MKRRIAAIALIVCLAVAPVFAGQRVPEEPTSPLTPPCTQDQTGVLDPLCMIVDDKVPFERLVEELLSTWRIR